MDITTCNIEEPQQKNHLGTEDDRFLCPEGGGGGRAGAGRPKKVLLLRFHLFYVRCCSIF